MTLLQENILHNFECLANFPFVCVFSYMIVYCFSRYFFLLGFIMWKTPKDLWFCNLIKSSVRNLFCFFYIIKRRWKEYLPRQWIILTDTNFTFYLQMEDVGIPRAWAQVHHNLDSKTHWHNPAEQKKRQYRTCTIYTDPQRQSRQRPLLPYQKFIFLFYLGWSGTFHKSDKI